jgi:hypothetical protein
VRHTQLVNYTLYQIGWFACVIGAPSQRPWTGCPIGMIVVGVHVALSVERVLEVRLVVLTTAVGAAVEMLQIAAGTYRFTSGAVNDASQHEERTCECLWPEDVRCQLSSGGGAQPHWSVIVPGGRVNAAAWSYADPLPEYERIRGYFAFLPISGRMRVRFNSSRRAARSVLRRLGHAGRRRTLQG